MRKRIPREFVCSFNTIYIWRRLESYIMFYYLISSVSIILGGSLQYTGIRTHSHQLSRSPPHRIALNQCSEDKYPEDHESQEIAMLGEHMS